MKKHFIQSVIILLLFIVSACSNITNLKVTESLNIIEETELKEDFFTFSVDPNIPTYIPEELIQYRFFIPPHLLEEIANKDIKIETFKETIITINGEVIIKMQKLYFGDKSIILPEQPNDFPFGFIVTTDGKYSILIFDDGLLAYDNEQDELIKLSNDKYENYSYLDLVEKSMELYGENIVHWNSGVIPSPNSTKLVYNSSKDKLNIGEGSLFVLDLYTGEEIVVNSEGKTQYLIEGWLNNESVICMKIQETGNQFVLMNITGNVIDLELEGNNPFIYAVSNSLIAYSNELSGDEIYIAKIDSLGNAETIHSFKLEGSTRLRVNNGFSHENQYFAFIFAPSQKDGDRYLKIVDLKTDNLFEVKLEENEQDYNILDFWWLNNDTLLVNIFESQSSGDESFPMIIKINN